MIYLKSDRLEVQLLYPGEGYVESRFDWSGIIKQVILDGRHTFLSEESEEMTFNKTGGIGLISSFEPAPADGLFNMTGYITDIIDDSSVKFIYEYLSNIKDKGLKFIKTVTVEGTSLAINHKIINLSDTYVKFGEYNHNFILIDNHKVGAEYEINVPFTIKLTDVMAGKYNILGISERKIGFEKGFENAKDDALIQIKGYELCDCPYSWEIIYKPDGIRIRETDDFEISKYQLWCNANTICNEIFVERTLNASGNAGDAFEWNRTYEFFKGNL